MGNLTEPQLKVLKEVFSDVNLTTSFLSKAVYYIHLTTNANEGKIDFEGSAGYSNVRGKLTFKIKQKKVRNDG